MRYQLLHTENGGWKAKAKDPNLTDDVYAIEYEGTGPRPPYDHLAVLPEGVVGLQEQYHLFGRGDWNDYNEDEILLNILDDKRIAAKYLPPQEKEDRKFVYFIEDISPSRQGRWFGMEWFPVTSWTEDFKAWTNDPQKAHRFETFEEAEKTRKELNMDGYIVTEHEFVNFIHIDKSNNVDPVPSVKVEGEESQEELWAELWFEFWTLFRMEENTHGWNVALLKEKYTITRKPTI